jgi:hypothetical protein
MSDSEGPPSEGLPSSGPERVIFLRALQQFSDECQPPELQPLCPFSVELVDEGRGCAEECMDILAEHGDPRTLHAGVDLGNGMSRSDGPFGSFARAEDLRRGVDLSTRRLRWYGTKTAVDPLPLGALFL